MFQIPILNPDSKWIKCWNALLWIVSLYNAIIIPFRIAFSSGAMDIWLPLDLGSDFVFIFDIFLRFHIGFFDQGDYIQNLQKIAYRYRHKDIILHLISSFPADLVLRLIMPQASIFWLGILRIPRLMRLPQSFKVIKDWENDINVNPTIFRMGQLIIIIFLIDHWVACFWFLIGSLEKLPDESWLTSNALNSSHVWTQYITSLYWAITTLTTVGYGDITPRNELETGFTIIVMFLGVSMYAYIIGNVVSLMANVDAAQAKHREKLDQVQAYMRQNKIPIGLQATIRNYYQYVWENHRDVSDFHVLDDLPHSLKTQVSLHLHREIIEKVPLFKNASRQFIEDIVMTLKPEVLPPNQYIIYEGQWGHEMYFIRRGQVQAFSEQKGKIYQILEPGSFFGEISLVYSSRRNASIKTLTYCELFVLERADFEKVLDNYPIFAEQVQQIAAERYHAGLKTSESQEDPKDWTEVFDLKSDI